MCPSTSIIENEALVSDFDISFPFVMQSSCEGNFKWYVHPAWLNWEWTGTTAEILDSAGASQMIGWADESCNFKSFYLLLLTQLAGKGNSTWHREVWKVFSTLWHHFLCGWHWIMQKEWWMASVLRFSAQGASSCHKFAPPSLS